jgi:hypothetical protein
MASIGKRRSHQQYISRVLSRIDPKPAYGFLPEARIPSDGLWIRRQCGNILSSKGLNSPDVGKSGREHCSTASKA